MSGRLLKTVLALSVLFTGSLLLSACGNKGPLYLPAEKSAAKKADSAAKENEEKPKTDGSTAK